MGARFVDPGLQPWKRARRIIESIAVTLSATLLLVTALD
jgi:hypothetical protein